MKKYIIGIFLVSVFLVTSGAICSNSGTMPEKVILKYWSPEHSETEIEAAITAFEASYPYIEIDFKNFEYEEYEDALISAWAKGEGPDIFSIPNTHVNKYYEYIKPLPPAVTVTTVSKSSKFGKEEILVKDIQQRTLTSEELKNQFVDTVYDDVVFPYTPEGEKSSTKMIFGIPINMDTLALFWNRDLLNQESISLPAANWQNLVDHTQELTKIDKEGNIIQSGVALGTSSNIDNYFDVMSILMMQFGADMTHNNNVIFNAEDDEDKRYPGIEALDFYSKFAQEEWETYTWSNDKNNALDSFASGELGYFIGYHYHLESIKKLNPNLNFDIAELPQITPEQQTNYASYWVESVADSSKQIDLAWAFVQYLASEENMKNYLAIAEKPAPRRALVNDQLENYELAIFAQQALTAKSWYRGKQPEDAKAIFAQMIDEALEGTFALEDIINDTAHKVELTFK